MWQGKVGKDFPLDYFGSNSVRRGKRRERKRKRKKERKEEKEEEKMSEKLHILSRFYGNQVVGFRRSKR